MGKERSYEKSSCQAVVRGKVVAIRNLTPVYTPREREKRKAEINRTLYEVFSKYR
ncbi:hypothetical protein [Faecalispora anaeroviscerum]|uniref:hypothetical protein n=1 Tax=Faecalispora anaeroviscerum TaxID=2991836 RepID=UPI0024B989C8|nr:hypothetical protein [Faecalispora anaeroviscerum]